DTTLGRFNHTVETTDDSIIIDGKSIKVYAEKDPAKLPWGELDVDVALESTGRFTKADKARAHLDAGAKKVLVSAPSKGADVTLAYGVNNDAYKPEHTVISNASCTTNSLAPLAKVLDDLAGIEQGFITRVHAYTCDEMVQDRPHKDPRRSRAADENIIPNSTRPANTDRLVSTR